MEKFRNTVKKKISNFKRKQELNARQTLLEELFNDYYQQRRKLYQMNFFRGIFFGLGSVLGGTIVVALIIWFLSVFVGLPLIGDLFEGAQNTIETGTE